MKNQVDDIKNHEWFNNFDWYALWKKSIVPPVTYTPPKKRRNFSFDEKFPFACKDVYESFIKDFDHHV